MPNNKVIHTVLTLRDEMSGGLLKAARNTKSVSREMQTATRQVVAFKNKAVSAITGAAKTFGKLTLAAGTAVTALAGKTGLSEALDLEGYRLQLETATKDIEKAASIMRYAIGLANKTPFEGGQMVEAAAKFEAMGMSAETWLTRAGDMAAATNKGMDQAAEALIDAQTGELERLKEFGITKAKILERGEKLFAGVQLVNGQGQIVNQEKFNDALIALMNDRFAGGMEKMAGTTKGLWSTVTGVTKSALAKIAGASEDGSIRAGSALDLLKSKVTLLADKLQAWQADGTIDRLADKFSNGLAWAADKAGQAFDWVREHGDTIVGVLKGVGVALAGIKILQFAAGVLTTVKTIDGFVQGLGQITAAASPVTLAILGVIAVGSLLAANWDWVKDKAKWLWDDVKTTFGGIKDSICGAFDRAKDGVKSFFDWFGDKLSWLDKKIESIPILGALYKGVKSGVGTVWSGLKSGASAVYDWASQPLAGAPRAAPTAGSGALMPALPYLGNALGTSYWRGGPTRVNERGGEIINLPGGSQVIPHDVSRRMAGGPRVNVSVTVAGNVIGNKQYADELGGVVAQKVLRALANT